MQLGEKGDLHLRTIPLTPRHDLRKLRGTFAQLTDKAFYQNTQREDYLYVTLVDEEDIPEAIGQLRMIYPNLLHLSYDNARTRVDQIFEGGENVQQKAPLELFDELYQLQNNQPLNPTQKTYLQDLIESIWEERL